MLENVRAGNYVEFPGREKAIKIVKPANEAASVSRGPRHAFNIFVNAGHQVSSCRQNCHQLPTTTPHIQDPESFLSRQETLGSFS